ncbi:MAG: hypothetical protein J7545_20575 [Roseofilum sp. SBFL]|uniref:calcium-binding protein n=1 Tax=unclassified Roseofilum TaxID=2620099 RepID=UPI001B05EF2E|nr:MULTISPECIES: hypothetical protein [unclassified Roseofilum]MBP0012770.1 hypothetical protein [Roseofilum sp. SID3]MBP0025149.1 hypothetical protein [Roseofilum sp. SID2]MBP0039764.1 hypothetical protein [Roseofilum sp. SID1]MBP0044337.1 hypothetical protein [Roseofilum sp. SBFL]
MGIIPTVLTNDPSGINGLSRTVATPTPVGLVFPQITAPTNDFVSLGANFTTGPGGLWMLDGNDTVIGSVGNQRILGNAGDDWLYGGNNQDKLAGGQGNDRLIGFSGRDLLLGNLGNDNLSGNQDEDTLRGGRGNDELNGGAGDDWLFGDFGKDELTGGAGFDTFVIRSNGFDTVIGGVPNSTVDPANPLNADVITDFNPQQDKIGLDSGLVYANLRFDTGQNIVGGTANDTIIFNNLNNQVLAVLQDYNLGINRFDVQTLTPFQQNLGSDFFGPFIDGIA